MSTNTHKKDHVEECLLEFCYTLLAASRGRPQRALLAKGQADLESATEEIVKVVDLLEGLLDVGLRPQYHQSGYAQKLVMALVEIHPRAGSSAEALIFALDERDSAR